MGCRVREYEMSLSLDGRLPSGRRALLMRHIAECDTCAQVWESMKEGQDLALSLPAFQVSGRFREGLRRRIESGEGAPEAVYRDPISTRTRVRYVLSGAAAAAVVIVALRLFAGEPGTPIAPDPRHDTLAEVSRGVTGPTETTRSPAVESPVQFASLNEFNELQLARTTADHAAHSAQRLRATMHATAGRPLQETWHEYEPVLVELQAAVGVLRWMDQKRLLTLPDPLENQVREADAFLEQAFHGPSWEVRHKALEHLQQMKIEGVRNGLQISCCLPKDELFYELGNLVIQMPEAASVFQVVDLGEASNPVDVRAGRPAKGFFMLRIESHSSRDASNH